MGNGCKGKGSPEWKGMVGHRRREKKEIRGNIETGELGLGIGIGFNNSTKNADFHSVKRDRVYS